MSNYVFGHYGLRHIDTELEQLTVDSRRTPQRKRGRIYGKDNALEVVGPLILHHLEIVR
jgi:hypothetical protein